MTGELDRIYGCWHDDDFGFHFTLTIQYFFKRDKSEIHLKWAFMDFIEYDMRIIDCRLEKQLLNKYTVGHVHNLGIFPTFGLHSNLISNHITQLFAVLFTNPLS